MAVLREKWSSADSDQKASIKFTVYEIVGLFTGIAISIGLNYNDLINFNSEAKSFFFQYMLGWICGAIIEIILEFIGILTKNFYLLIFICAIRWLMSAFFIIIFVCFLSIWFDGFKWYFVLIYPLATLFCGYKAVIFMKMIKNVYLSRIEENCGKEESIKA